MRELKFRGWCEDSYKYDIVVIDETNFMDCWDGWVFKGKVEQYTGLKDKNGKEIYEGDIVKENIFDDYDNEHIIWVVEWRKDECAFKLRYYRNKCLIGDNSLTDDIKKSYEVIGNIHENKELLDE